MKESQYELLRIFPERPNGRDNVITKFYYLLCGYWLLSVCISPANALEQDFFPLAVGNWWEFNTKTGQIERWEITNKDSVKFILTRINKDPDYSSDYHFQPFDDNGRINTPCKRNQGCWWAPQVMLPGTDTLVTPWGTVEKNRQFPVTWGHPTGFNRSCITAPGIGPVASLFEGQGIFDTAALLTDYHLETVPTTRSHSITGDAQADTGLLVSWTEGSTAEVSAYSAGLSDAQWYTVSSYNPLTRSIRIYLADTASHPSDENPAMESYEHLFTIEHLDPDSLYRFKMYLVAYTTLPPEFLGSGYDSIQSSLLYDRPLVLDKVSAAKALVHYSVLETGFTVSGRTVRIRSGIPDTRMTLSYTLFSVDGRCIVQHRIDEQQEKVNMVVPGAGVYVLRINGGTSIFRTFRIIIAQ